MPTSRTPLFLFDNVFDSVMMFPTATISASATQAGTDVLNLASYRRERDYWTAGTTAPNHWVMSQIATAKSPNFIWVDRGHNLWGKVIIVETSSNGTFTQPAGRFITLTVPALNADGTYTPGGDPTTNVMAVTEEGTLYSVFTPLTAGTYIRVWISSALNPILTGVMVGVALALDIFANKFDEDASTMKVNTRESDAGWLAADKAYTYQTLEVALAIIGDATYDNQIRQLKFWLYQKRQPVVIVMNYGTYPSRAWLYQITTTAYSFGKSRVFRSGSLTFRECGPRIL